MRKTILLALVLMLLVIGLGACAPQTVVKTVEVQSTVVVPSTVEVMVTPTPVTHAPVTIKVEGSSQQLQDFYNEAVTIFQKQYPWITVKWETMASADYQTALPLMFTNNESPDIFEYLGVGDAFLALNEVQANKWVQPLDETALDSGFRDRFANTQQLMDGIFSSDGKIYGLPTSEDGPGGYGYMFYNPDVLTAAGLDPSKDIPTTWDQLETVCKQIRNGGKGPYCISLAHNDVTQLQRILYPLIELNGGSPSLWTSLQTGMFNLEDPATIQVLEFVRKLYQEDLIMPGIVDKAFSRAAMANGKAAFYFDGGWMTSVFPGSFGYTKYGVAAVPAPTSAGYKGHIAIGMSAPTIWISSQSKHPYEASLFLNWMTQPDGWYTTQYLARGNGFLPWADNARYVVDPGNKALIPLAAQMQVVGPPNAVLKCPDLAKSQAMTAVDQMHPDWDWEVISNYWLNGGDIQAQAKKVDDAQNALFTKTLNDEKAAGLNVSPDCFAAPDWNVMQNYDMEAFFKAHPVK